MSLGDYQDYCDAEGLRKWMPSMVDIRFLGSAFIAIVGGAIIFSSDQRSEPHAASGPMIV